MIHSLSKLPYKFDALSPKISQETLEFHYNKHHKNYLNNLNKLIKNTNFENMSIEEIVKSSSGSIFNNAAQVWNHSFYWKCMSPESNIKIDNQLIIALKNKWGSLKKFKENFIEFGMKNFGSGWVWLVKKNNNLLEIINTSNAITPLNTSDIPLLTMDVWEHAYYIDYRNNRLRYIENFLDIINWNFVFKNFKKNYI
ncbi:superoxide dismutase [Candidatus Profftella armatura]|uniref:Superoxide dismutase n=1 Tax=Candidatus Profftella armatura TaxID=669502 RepID=S5RPY0_9PROT|nr:Fe-Mn family superoxide dismutase [Candidatus Profftella armatura]AGS06933.1 superoxide dismutase [Candidatus Profftella armatura]ALC96010.1 superoxide dismutase [Candidatus Profftella armatura]QLK13838.1 superoxide dismutase [Fe] [Candidatus Profftella armatura]